MIKASSQRRSINICVETYRLTSKTATTKSDDSISAKTLRYVLTVGRRKNVAAADAAAGTASDDRASDL